MSGSLPYLLGISVLSAASVYAESQAYRYKVVAQTGQIIDGITLTAPGTPFLPDDGRVLFVGFYAGTAVCVDLLCHSEALFTRNSVLAKAGDVIDGLTLGQIYSASKNDRGEVVFLGAFNRGVPGSGFTTGLFRLKSKVAAFGDTIGGLTIQSPQSFQLSDSGEIVFDSAYVGPNAEAGGGIFTQHRVVAKTGDTIGGITLSVASAPAVSKWGAIAFKGTWLLQNNTAVTGVFTPTSVVAKAGDTIQGLTLTGMDYSNPTIGESGVIGFEAFIGPGKTLFTEQSVVAKAGDTIDGHLLTLVGNEGTFHINARGEALFYADFNDASGVSAEGIFTNNHLIASDGDTIAGLAVRSVGVDAVINDKGQVAFTVLLAAGGTALIVATPTGN